MLFVSPDSHVWQINLKEIDKPFIIVYQGLQILQKLKLILDHDHNIKRYGYVDICLQADQCSS